MPWDVAMRKEFGCDGSKESYFKFLVDIKKLAYRIGELCEANDFDNFMGRHPRSRNRYTWNEALMWCL